MKEGKRSGKEIMKFKKTTQERRSGAIFEKKSSNELQQDDGCRHRRFSSKGVAGLQ